jgi:hypothetical protein
MSVNAGEEPRFSAGEGADLVVSTHAAPAVGNMR